MSTSGSRNGDSTKSEIRDDLNPEIRKEIEALGWECTNDDANIGDDRHFEKTTDGKKEVIWQCIHWCYGIGERVCWARAYINGRCSDHKYYAGELMDAINNVNQEEKEKV